MIAVVVGIRVTVNIADLSVELDLVHLKDLQFALADALVLSRQGFFQVKLSGDHANLFGLEHGRLFVRAVAQRGRCDGRGRRGEYAQEVDVVEHALQFGLVEVRRKTVDLQVEVTVTVIRDVVIRFYVVGLEVSPGAVVVGAAAADTAVDEGACGNKAACELGLAGLRHRDGPLLVELSVATQSLLQIGDGHQFDEGGAVAHAVRV